MKKKTEMAGLDSLITRGDQKAEGQSDKTIEMLRLLLVAQLVEHTGVPWTVVIVDVQKYDALFKCRWGFGKYQNLRKAIHLEKTDKYLDDLMKTVALGIVVAYGRRMENEAKEKLDDDE